MYMLLSNTQRFSNFFSQLGFKIPIQMRYHLNGWGDIVFLKIYARPYVYSISLTYWGHETPKLVLLQTLKIQIFDLIWFFMSQSKMFQLCWDRSSWVEPVLSKVKWVLLKYSTEWRWWGSNPWPLGLKSSTLPLSHCAPYEDPDKMQKIHHYNNVCTVCCDKTFFWERYQKSFGNYNLQPICTMDHQAVTWKFCWVYKGLNLYPIETPFDASANRADPDQAALVRLCCLWIW